MGETRGVQGPGRRGLAGLLAGTSACWILFGLGLAWGQQEEARFAIQSNLILVDVRVLDEKGQPVTGLTRGDFVVTEEGVEQPISFFREIVLPLDTSRKVRLEPDTVSPGKEAVRETEPGREDSTSPDLLEKRLLILLFDFSSANLQDSQMMERAARKFLDEQLTPEDAVSVLVLDNGLEMLVDLTSDREKLSEAIGRLVTTDTESDISSPDDDSSASGDFIADETEFGLFESNQRLVALQTIADAFRDVPGRKALLYFSSGFSSRGIENDEQMRLATDECNKANMSIYSVDARGLVALSPGGGAHRGSPGGTQIFSGRSGLNELVRLSQSQEGLITLAEDTGGQALLDDNDLGKIFRTAQEDSSHYYLLGYQTALPPADGRFRKIEVRTSSGRASKVLSRRGYWTERPYRQLSAQEREYKLFQTIVDDRPVADFPVLMSAEYFPEGSETYQVPVLLSFQHSQLRELEKSEDLNLEIIIVARDPSGATRSGIRDRLQIKRQEKGGETAYIYQNLLVLEPGHYQLAAFVRDNRTGLLSRSEKEVDLPLQDPIRFSSLVLAGDWRDPESESGYRIKRGKEVTVVKNPLLISDRILVPRVNHAFRQSESLFLYGTVSGSVLTPSYRLQIFDEGGETVFAGEWTECRQEPDRSFAVMARFRLGELGVGSYQIRVDIRNGSVESEGFEQEFEVQAAHSPAS